MSIDAADPKKSRILLVGTPEHDDAKLPAVPQVARNLIDLGAVLTDPDLGGFDATRCVAAPFGADHPTVVGMLYDAAEAAQDLLLFYYSGHGMLDHQVHLYLSLRASRRDRLIGSALNIAEVRQVFQGSQARNKVMIIDSCFSGRAIVPTLADDAVTGQLRFKGTYTLASAHSNSPALAPIGEEHTAFTGRMLRLLREGSPQAGEMLTLRDIHRLVSRQLREDELPEPQNNVTATTDELGLVRNRAFTRPAPRLRRPAAAVPGADYEAATAGSGSDPYPSRGSAQGSHTRPGPGSVPVERLRAAEDLAGTIIAPTWAAYALAITAWAAASDGDLGRAQQLTGRGLTALEGGGAPCAEPGPLAALARAAAAAGFTEARGLATRAEVALSAALLQQDPTLLGMVVRAAADADDALQVRRLLDRAEQSGQLPLVGSVIQRATAARAAAAAGEAARARQLADGAEQLAAEYVRQPLLRGYSSIFFVSDAMWTAAELSRAAAACSDSARAQRLFDQACRSFDMAAAPGARVLRTVSSHFQQQSALVHAQGLHRLVVAALSLASAATELGAADYARQVADQARRDAQRIKVPLGRASAMACAAQATALIGDTDTAQDMARVITDDGSRQVALVSIVAALVAWPH